MLVIWLVTENTEETLISQSAHSETQKIQWCFLSFILKHFLSLYRRRFIFSVWDSDVNKTHCQWNILSAQLSEQVRGVWAEPLRWVVSSHTWNSRWMSVLPPEAALHKLNFCFWWKNEGKPVWPVHTHTLKYFSHKGITLRYDLYIFVIFNVKVLFLWRCFSL